jgi:hypothetical protein
MLPASWQLLEFAIILNNQHLNDLFMTNPGWYRVRLAVWI